MGPPGMEMPPTSRRLGLLVCVADFGKVLVNIRAEITKPHQRVAARVFDFDAAVRRLVGDEHLILCAGTKPDHYRRLNIQRPHPTAALNTDPAARAGILQRATCSWLER